MRVFSIALILGLFVLPFGAAVSRAEDGDSGTRGLFIGSRPKKSAPRPAHHSTAKKPDPKQAPETPVGLGFSLYRVADAKHAVRVDPSATFLVGDKLRFVLESAVDGYLYVFVATGDGKPAMIFPDPRLEEGDNFVYAHTVAEVPSRRNPRFDVFKIAGEPATEHVYFVVSRAPLADVPIGQDLVRYCKTGSWPWSPEQKAWNLIAQGAAVKTEVSEIADAGAAITAGEQEALARELVLGSSDPQPSVVALNVSADTPMLVHQVSIRHE